MRSNTRKSTNHCNMPTINRTLNVQVIGNQKSRHVDTFGITQCIQASTLNFQQQISLVLKIETKIFFNLRIFKAVEKKVKLIFKDYFRRIVENLEGIINVVHVSSHKTVRFAIRVRTLSIRLVERSHKGSPAPVVSRLTIASSM